MSGSRNFHKPEKLETALRDYYESPIVRFGDEKIGRKPGLVEIARKHGVSKSALHRYKQSKEEESSCGFMSEFSTREIVGCFDTPFSV